MSQAVQNDVTAAVRVMLVDDHEIWRDGVRAMLKNTEFMVVGEASSAMECILKLPSCHADIVLLDIRMLNGDGFEALANIKRLDPNATVLMLTTYESPTFMARAVAGGASGYLLKGISRDEFLSALRRSAAGEILMTPKDLIQLLNDIAVEAAHSRDVYVPLSPRELEVLELISTGLPNRAIGSVLGITDGTVKSHVEHILSKLGLPDRLRAAVWAARLEHIATA